MLRSTSCKTATMDVPDIADAVTRRNRVRVLCTKCESRILNPNAAVYVSKELALPFVNASAKAAARAAADATGKGEVAESETLNEFWQVSDMMSFENIGFTMTVDNKYKYLCCADCEVGPLGVQLLQESPPACYLSVNRTRFQLV